MLALPAGGFLIADTFNNRIRRVWPDGIITTVAGTGTPGFSGDGPADSVELNEPKALALLPDGRVLVGDAANDRLRVLTLAPLAPPRVATLRVLGGSLLDVRFRVCDGSHDGLTAELRLTGPRSSRVVTETLPSTRGGCLPFRLRVPRRTTTAVTLRVRDDLGRWSAVAERRLRPAAR
jgi:hypothetical protein